MVDLRAVREEEVEVVPGAEQVMDLTLTQEEVNHQKVLVRLIPGTQLEQRRNKTSE